MLHKNEQKGMTLLGYVIVLCVIGFFALLLVRVAPLYLEYRSVVTIVDAVADEATAEWTPAMIRNTIQKRLDVNNIKRIDSRDFVVSRDRGGATLSIDYEARTGFIGNLSLLMEFEHSADLRAR